MRHIHSTSSRPAIAALSVALTALALAACGGGSSTSSTQTTNAAATSTGGSSTTTTTGTGTTGASRTTGTNTGAPGAPGGGGGRFAALSACLAKDGIKLPQRKPGQRLGAGGFFGAGAGAAGLSSGVSRPKFEAAIRKCGGFSSGRFPRGRFPGAGGGRFNSPAVKAAYTKFAACMRENGVNLPAPNTSGKAPVFNDKGLKLSSPTFKAAERKCRSILFEGFRGAPPSAG
jgi:hypothetical protein